MTTRRDAQVGVPGNDAAIAVRAFCPADGSPEDPATGSANAGRDGRVDIEIEADSGIIRIGGQCASCIVGQLDFDEPCKEPRA